MTTPAAPRVRAAEQAAELRSQRRRRIAARTDQVRAHAAARAAEYTGAPQAWLNVMRDATRDVAAAAEQHMIEHVLDLLDMFPTTTMLHLSKDTEAGPTPDGLWFVRVDAITLADGTSDTLDCLPYRAYAFECAAEGAPWARFAKRIEGDVAWRNLRAVLLGDVAPDPLGDGVVVARLLAWVDALPLPADTTDATRPLAPGHVRLTVTGTRPATEATQYVVDVPEDVATETAQGTGFARLTQLIARDGRQDGAPFVVPDHGGVTRYEGRVTLCSGDAKIGADTRIDVTAN